MILILMIRGRKAARRGLALVANLHDSAWLFENLCNELMFTKAGLCRCGTQVISFIYSFLRSFTLSKYLRILIGT